MIRNLRTHLTRLVLVAAVLAAVAVGSVALGPRHDAAAMPMECGRLWSQARYFASQAEFYKANGDTFNYLINRANMQASFDAYNAACW